jgi:cysteinyl-tRNA synthetase
MSGEASEDPHFEGARESFPHNENENAICESLSGKPMARYWLRAGLVLGAGKKMSRSSGTALTFRDPLGGGYTGSQVRYCLLQTHYRWPAEFSLEKLDAACRGLARLNGLIKNLRQVVRSGGPHKAVDELRNELEALGVTIEDTPGGSRVRRRGET